MIPQSIQYYSQGNWQVFFDLLSHIEQRIVHTIASDNFTTSEIADKCLGVIDFIEPMLVRLNASGIIYKFDSIPGCEGVWAIERQEFRNYCQTIPTDTVFDAESIVAELTEEFYRLATKRYSRIQELGTDLSLLLVHQAIGKKISQRSCRSDLTI